MDNTVVAWEPTDEQNDLAGRATAWCGNGPCYRIARDGRLTAPSDSSENSVWLTLEALWGELMEMAFRYDPYDGELADRFRAWRDQVALTLKALEREMGG